MEGGPPAAGSSRHQPARPRRHQPAQPTNTNNQPIQPFTIVNTANASRIQPMQPFINTNASRQQPVMANTNTVISIRQQPMQPFTNINTASVSQHQPVQPFTNINTANVSQNYPALVNTNTAISSRQQPIQPFTNTNTANVSQNYPALANNNVANFSRKQPMQTFTNTNIANASRNQPAPANNNSANASRNPPAPANTNISLANTSRNQPAPANNNAASASRYQAAPAKTNTNAANVSQNQPAQPTSPNEAIADEAEKDFTKIYISGFPPFTQPGDMIRALNKFGPARIERLTPRFCAAVMPTHEAAKAAAAASGQISVYGEILTVKPYTAKLARVASANNGPKMEFPKSKQKGIIVDPVKLDLTGDFYQQLDKILATIRLTQEEATSISHLYSDVESVLQSIFPGCRAMPFGSITTGLGIKSSDADCFVMVPPALAAAAGGAGGAGVVAKAKRALQQHPDVFTELLAIPKANTPLLKFFHAPTATTCDLSFKTPLGHQNSQLIAYLLHSDPRLIPVAVAIKYWAKVHGLSGTGKLTNYALTMMIIFYLQQPPISILPSVEWLQRDRAHDVIVDYWNTGFIGPPNMLQPSQNTSTIQELLGGFYEYYSLFNFEEMVVCPLTGAPIKKDLFKDLTQLPLVFERYKQNVMHNLVMPMRFLTPMCVQDPFELSHNVASAVSIRMAAEIKAYFKFAANAYEKEKLNNCQEFFKTILLQKPKVVRAKSHPEFRVNLFPRMIGNIIEPDWKSVIREVIFTIFEKMLKLTLGKVEEKLNTESKKEKEKYIGVVTKSIWKRKQSSRKYEMCNNLDLQEKQARISEEILKSEKKTYNMHFQMTVTYAHNPKSAVVSIKLAEGEVEAFKDFGKFFISVMQGWFMALLRPYTRPSEIDMAAKIAETIKYLDSNLDVNTNIESDEDDEVEATQSADAESARSDIHTELDQSFAAAVVLDTH